MSEKNLSRYSKAASEKYNKISHLAEETVENITKNPEEWKSFLSTASRLYKYPFHEQVLIYAQRPEANACASIEIWNEKMHCWVNKGAKGIALIDENSVKPKLKYVFDVADVHPSKYIGRYPNLWKFEDEYKDIILKKLENTYGSTNSDLSFEDRIISISEKVAAEYLDIYLEDLNFNTEESFLEELDEQNVYVHFKETMSSSIAFMLFNRCNLDVERYEEAFNFEFLTDFNTFNTASILGNAASELAKPILMEIGKSIGNITRDKANRKYPDDRNKNNLEKENISIAKQLKIDYSTLKRKSENEIVNKNVKEENNDEIRLYDERGLYDTEFSSGFRTIRGTDQVRIDEKEISQGTSRGNLSSDDSQRNTEKSLSGDTESGREKNGLISRTDEEGRGDYRGNENTESITLDSQDEQHQSFSGGNRAERTDISLNTSEFEENSDFEQLSLFPSFEEQVGNIAAAHAGEQYQMPVAYFLSEEQMNEILKTGGGKENSRKRIFSKYVENLSHDEMVDYLIKEYEVTAKGFEFDNHNISVWFDPSGIRVGYGMSAFENPVHIKIGQEEFVGIIPWETAENQIRNLVFHSEYLSTEEAYLAIPEEINRIAEEIYFYFRDGVGELPEKFLEKEHDVPDCVGLIAQNLETEDGIKYISEELEKVQSLIKDGKIDIKIRFVYDLKDLIDEINFLKRERIEIDTVDHIDCMREGFITQDEIDQVLISGSGFHDGDFRIYDFFKTNPEDKAAIDFLKKEYGTGGNTHALIGADHSYRDYDAKGIQLKKGNIFEPYASVILNWNVVQKRIRQLVNDEKYIQNKRKTAYDKYRSRIEEKALETAKEELIDNNEIEVEQTISEPADNEIIIDKTMASNFQIENDMLGNGSPKDKFSRNIEAIKTLYKIESENRIATKEEQFILSNYVGWGGLADAFDETKRNWTKEYVELRELLSLEEYAQARESTLNAHYTNPVIIREMFATLHRMGFEKGNILEPSMGIGNFFGMLPDSMSNSKLYGVELDDLTGRIAKQLYPKANIFISGYEKTDFQNDFFDIAIGNVPFGQYKVVDRKFDKFNFLIHDYFFAKTIDKVRPGGIIAFITSKGTMDKENAQVRKYLAQRAELLGAIRLPNNAFKENAGTEVTSDILFLKKRDRILDIEPEWVHLDKNEDGILMNQYFVDHPENIVGSMKMISCPFGLESSCEADLSSPFDEQLRNAMSHIEGEIDTIELDELEDELAEETIIADPNVKNYSYTLVGDKVYYRENSVMKPVDMSDSMIERIKGMVEIRDITQELINLQLEEHSEEEIRAKQQELNQSYDSFSDKFGIISSKINKRAFNQDSSYCLLCSLEKLDDEGNFKGKADMFYKRTIKKAVAVSRVDTASEALAVSLSEKGCVDLDYMKELCDKEIQDIIEELKGVIFKDPIINTWMTADEYLSGNVREKLIIAKQTAESNPMFFNNVRALEKIQPKELEASDIEVRIGATWIDKEYINDFMSEVFQTPQYLLNRETVTTNFSNITGQWNIQGKNADYGNTLTTMTYGTSRVNAYKILEDSLNLKDTRVYDTIYEDGKEKRVLNKKETMIASQKQESIRETFKNWIFQDQDRREKLVSKYNILFNSTRPREYDGSHLKFPRMTPDIELKPHQKNAVAHVLYGDNTLLAHCVGAGKTFEMTAAAMESKRLGLCQKSLFVVPNHLTEQWSSDFLRLYPGANILAATKKDFEPANRKKFCSRIATGDYDAVIIGHSQFEKIPLSKERQISIIENQINEIEENIAIMKAERGERYTVKEMEKTKKSLKAKLEKLNDDTRKDNVVTFEQLGVDRLFVDESHNYKNLFLYTKMRNVAGIAQTEAQKSSDMFAKCQYLDEITGGKGITFATGTPISNSMTELYTNMRYLQYGTLQRMGLGQFDAWASSFGETQTAIELAPEGTGYRAKTRFAKFFNLPELISLFKESADIQTPDMLNLPVPKAEYENVVLKPSEYQKEFVKTLADRAEAVRNHLVDSTEDNMLKITNDGRKLALDQRLMNDMLPDNEYSKASVCVDKAFDIWERTKEKKSAQLIFCDLSTPKGDGSFNVYDDIKTKLMDKGVPEKEIAFIHEANTEIRKAELFAKVRSGQVRFLLGSTAKMGAGTNVQDRLIALHHLDVPWRPSDIEQQEGRILRQGNTNEKVKIFRYVTEGTFDSYSWQLIENKQKFIGQIMTSKSPVRSCEDIDEAALSYAEVKALATGNPYIKEKMDLDIQVSKLKLMKANHTSQKYRLEDNIAKNYPMKIAAIREKISGYEKDIENYQNNKPVKIQNLNSILNMDEEEKEPFTMEVAGKTFTEKKDAGAAILSICRQIKSSKAEIAVGEYRGFKMMAEFDYLIQKFQLVLKGELSHYVELGSDPLGNITRINNVLESMDKILENEKNNLTNVEHQLETAKVEVEKPFESEQELNEKLERLAELNSLLNMDETEEIGDEEVEVNREPLERPSVRGKLEKLKCEISKDVIENQEIKNLSKGDQL